MLFFGVGRGHLKRGPNLFVRLGFSHTHMNILGEQHPASGANQSRLCACRRTHNCPSSSVALAGVLGLYPNSSTYHFAGVPSWKGVLLDLHVASRAEKKLAGVSL